MTTLLDLTLLWLQLQNKPDDNAIGVMHTTNQVRSVGEIAFVDNDDLYIGVLGSARAIIRPR
jgi:hypothetical protein